MESEDFFLDAPGGTGKTFLISLILATIRSQKGIVLALLRRVLQLHCWKAVEQLIPHSSCRRSMRINERRTFNLSINSAMAKQSKFIIWDECTMAHKKSLEALHRTLQDLRKKQKLFGGAMILLAGDFRKTLPVIPRSTQLTNLTYV